MRSDQEEENLRFFILENHVFDTTLFNSVKRDDRLALDALFTRYYSRLCSFAHTYVQNRHDAEEIVADVFINVWKARHTITITTSLRAYLYISVKHGVFAKLKKDQPDVLSIDDVLLDIRTETSDPLDVIVYQELENHFETIIDNLPPRCRQIFVMKWFDGLKYKEIGEILGVAEKTVENQVVKAFDVVRKSLRKFQSMP